MTSPATPTSLAELDAVRPAEVDDAHWSANLAALAEIQGDSADALRGVKLPSSWRPVRGLDDSITFRLEEAGQPAAWLGNTAAPDTRAAALISQTDAVGKNVALPTIGAGAELRTLLETLPNHTAVFVFETDLRALRAVLGLYDFSAALTTRRCVLVPPTDEGAFLDALMEAEPGLLPPGSILLPNLVSDERLSALRKCCERVHAKTMQRRGVRLQALAGERAAKTAPSDGRPRLALLALTPRGPARSAMRTLESAARALGWPVLSCEITTPGSVHPLVHCERLLEFGPSVTVCVDHARTALPLSPGGAVAVWWLSAASVPEAVTEDDTIHLVASPRTAEALRQAGAKAGQLVPWYWGCAVRDVPGVSPEAVATGPTPASDTVVLVGDMLSLQPALYGLTQPSHLRLWEQLHAVATRDWAELGVRPAGDWLTRAERACGVVLSDQTLRDNLTRLIEMVLTPAVILEQVTAVLRKESVGVLAIGDGWARFADERLAALSAEEAMAGGGWPGAVPIAGVFAGAADPFGPVLVRAAACGWPLLIHSAGGRSLEPVLGDVLREKDHVEVFADGVSLIRALRDIRAARPQAIERAARARQYVQAYHSYERRLEALSALVANEA